MRMVTRRTFFQRLTGLLGGAGILAIPSALRAQKAGEADVTAMVRDIVDLMLPADHIPGAVALGIDGQITALAAQHPELHAVLRDGCRWLDAEARRAKGRGFLQLPEAGRIASLEAAERAGASAGVKLVATLRSIAMARYYSHPAIQAAFAYAGPPQPAGFLDFEDKSS